MKKYYSKSMYIAFLAPALILYTVFLIAPAFVMIPISFQNNNSITNLGWVGWANYKELFLDKNFWLSQKNVLILLVVSLATFPLSWSVAFAFNKTSGWVSKVFSFAALFPSILAITSIGKLFQGVFNANWGLVNSFLDLVGLGNLKHAWLSSKDTAMWCVAIVSIYSGLGVGVVIKNAAMKSIPQNYVEAALLDGCTQSQADWKIRLPLLRNLIQFDLITGVVGTMCTYALVQVMAPTIGGSYISTPIIQIVETSMTKLRFGLGCAMALVYFVECVIVSIIVIKATDWENIEY